MKKFPVFVVACILISCSSNDPKSPLAVKTILPDKLKEISGMTSVGSDIWVITDKPKARVFRLDSLGRVVQTVNILNMEATDVEAVTSDNHFIYIGDVGDNLGDRVERKIIKISRTAIPPGPEVQVTGETIDFTFPEGGVAANKKQNNFDCESLISFKDSLYVFTKDREDKETRLYSVPKLAGKYSARYISTFNSDGLITDAGISPTNNELALIGYHKNHLHPFIILFNKFKGNDFFSGDHERIELASRSWDWQLEGISYGDNDLVYFSCEGTKQVPATFYGIKRTDIFKLNKKNKKNVDDGQEE